MIRKIINESIHSLLSEAYRLEPNMVPSGIRNWANAQLKGRVTKYELEQRGEVGIGIPFFEGDLEYYQMFRLVDGDAIPMEDVSFYRSGLEGDGGQITGKKVEGDAVIPSGHVLAKASSYLRIVTLYTSSDAMKMLVPSPSDQEELSDMELLALFQARHLVSSYRHKFSPEVYQKLMNIGFMNKNKSITNKGRNALESPEFIERLGDRYSSYKLDKLIREGISPERRKEAVAFSKELKKHLARTYSFPSMKAQLSKSVMEDPYIMVSARESGGIPPDLKRDCLILVYGLENADKLSMGNITSNYIAMHWSQWEKLMKQI